MLRALSHGVLILSLLISVSAIELEFGRCGCDGGDGGFWSIEAIMQCQKLSDLLIAVAYFSIPLELLYFATCSDLFPLKWIVLQFGAFIVLCGLTHLLNVFTYEPHSFHLVLSLTVAKFLTALVSFATAITLLTLIPQLLRVKVREVFLRIKASELDREVGMMKKQEEASWHVRMLTQEIRKSLDRHTILYTTMVELSRVLDLQNCAVWMPEESRKEMVLTHQSTGRGSSDVYQHSISIDDPDVVEIKNTKGMKILGPDSALSTASSGGLEPGAIAAIRMPLLNVSNFKGGTPQVMQANYAILVLVLPRDDSRSWSYNEQEIVEVVADQVAVALSHAAVLEESQLMRDKLAEQYRALLQAKHEAVMATEARNSVQSAMSEGMRRPMHTIVGLLSMMQEEDLSPEQRLVVNSIMKTSSVASTLISDVMETSTMSCEHLSLVMRPFDLHCMIKEAISIIKCLCGCKRIGFAFQVESTLPERVIGDEKRVLHVLLHMVGNLVGGCNGAGGSLLFTAQSYDEVREGQGQEWMPWKSKFSGGYICLTFKVRIKRSPTNVISSSSTHISQRRNSDSAEMDLSFSMCKKLVQMMNGNIWSSSNSQGLAESIKLILQFRLQPLTPVSAASSELSLVSSVPNFKGLRVLLVDNDDVNRAVTCKLLKKLGCSVSSVSSGTQCLSQLDNVGTPFQLVILDLSTHKTDWFEVAVRIRKFSSGCWPLIVLLAASAEKHVRDQCLHSGINGLIRKPVTLAALGDELYRVLQNN